MIPINYSGLCQCGCGQKAPIAKENRPSRGLIKGYPSRFISGHASSPFRADRPKWTVDKDTGCWLWTGFINADGYGVAHSARLGHSAHRAAYAKYVGPIPDGMELDHRCRVRRCVNPDHLEPVTREENARRANNWSYRDGVPIECGRGHDLTATDAIYVHRGRRQCRKCRALAEQRRAS